MLFVQIVEKAKIQRINDAFGLWRLNLIRKNCDQFFIELNYHGAVLGPTEASLNHTSV